MRHQLVAIDTETTGLRAGYNDLIQIGAIALDSKLQEMGDPFEVFVKPIYPERIEDQAMKVNGLDADELLLAAPTRYEALKEFKAWQRQFGKKLFPLAQNWPFDKGFLEAFIGAHQFNSVFHYEFVDTKSTANDLNFKAMAEGKEIPFPSTSLAGLCKALGIENVKAHDAVADARATAEVYRELLSHQG